MWEIPFFSAEGNVIRAGLIAAIREKSGCFRLENASRNAESAGASWVEAPSATGVSLGGVIRTHSTAFVLAEKYVAVQQRRPAQVSKERFELGTSL